MDAAHEANPSDVPIIADGGIRRQRVEGGTGNQKPGTRTLSDRAL
jgi:hypothetical protein